MKTTTVPATRVPGALAPARPIRPRPLWERDDLFKAPVFPDGLTLIEDDDEDDE